jgi:hypothetical protein
MEKAMSKDMLRSVVRAAAGVSEEHLDTLAKIASKFSLSRPHHRPEGEVWHRYLQHISEQGLPESAYLLGVTVTEVDLGEIVVNYDETTDSVLASETGRTLIGQGEQFRRWPKLDVGMFLPVPRTGSVRYKASAVMFGTPLVRGVILEWFGSNKRIMGGLHEGIALTLSVSQLKLGCVLPLVMFSDCRWDRFEYSYSPIFCEAEKRICLDLTSFDNGKNPTLFGTGWRFLTLQELPAAA